MAGAVVLFSGGQDSTTCLAWAIEQYGINDVYPVTFDYGQRHRVEIEQSEIILNILGVPNEQQVFEVPFLRTLPAALTQEAIDVEAKASDESQNVFARKHGLPSTFVPGRNMLFLTMAAAYGATRGIYDLVTGVCEADAAGYPDCRASFIHRASQALSEALGDLVVIHAPLVQLNKARTFALADKLGVLDIVLEFSHTCYRGERGLQFEWGYGCGTCPACKERAKGWEEFTSAAR